jgi:hypothetical protein
MEQLRDSTHISQHETTTPTKTARYRSSDVRAFLDRFATALTAGDTKTIASMWALPSMVIADQGVRLVTTRDEIEEFFAGAKDDYNSRGITDTYADILRLEWPTPRTAVVDVRWPNLEENGIEIGSETSTYTLRYDEQDDLKLQVALMRGTASLH